MKASLNHFKISTSHFEAMQTLHPNSQNVLVSNGSVYLGIHDGVPTETLKRWHRHTEFVQVHLQEIPGNNYAIGQLAFGGVAPQRAGQWCLPAQETTPYKLSHTTGVGMHK